MARVCTRCEIEKPESEYYIVKGRLLAACKSCIKESNKAYYHQNVEARKKYNKQWVQENKDRLREYKKEWRIKNDPKGLRRYGLTQEDMVEYCEVCGKHESENSHGRLFVDHDHKTGKVRGFLCHGCNIALGGVQDDPKILEKLAQYLYERNVDGDK